MKLWMFQDSCRVSWAHIRESRYDSCLGFEVNVLEMIEVVPSSLGSGFGFRISGRSSSGTGGTPGERRPLGKWCRHKWPGISQLRVAGHVHTSSSQPYIFITAIHAADGV